MTTDHRDVNFLKSSLANWHGKQNTVSAHLEQGLCPAVPGTPAPCFCCSACHCPTMLNTLPTTELDLTRSICTSAKAFPRKKASRMALACSRVYSHRCSGTTDRGTTNRERKRRFRCSFYTVGAISFLSRTLVPGMWNAASFPFRGD